MILSIRDEQRLVGVHPDLARVIRRAAGATSLPFTVLEGVRTLARQRQLLAQGATTTLKSRHLNGRAIDIAPTIDGTVRWDWPLYYQLAPIVKAAAVAEAVPIEWGGDWRKFKDGPHWQLPWKVYP